jgi:hypothetical protein
VQVDERAIGAFLVGGVDDPVEHFGGVGGDRQQADVVDLTVWSGGSHRCADRCHGMTALALIVPGVGTLGVAGILAAGGVTGALTGGFWGVCIGIKAEEHILDEEWNWERTRLQPGEVMVSSISMGDSGYRTQARSPKASPGCWRTRTPST